MFINLILLTLLIGISHANNCLKCICDQESGGCKPIGCKPDVGSLSCGYYQIKLPYYKDCGEPGRRAGEGVEAAWKRCSDDYSCATTCVNNYINRYRGSCPGKGECERTARLHNGGPNGCKKSSTNAYWEKVKRCCNCS